MKAKKKPLRVEWHLETQLVGVRRWHFHSRYRTKARAVADARYINATSEEEARAVRVEIYAVKGKR